jgi:DNA (cytosine-5)-methyltransferase 1
MVNQQSPYAGMRELALFAGAGGGLLASKILGWRTVGAVEWDDYARNVLVARQNDGSLETFPIWDDVQTFDGRLWRGMVDVISGGFPCQDISTAGKGAGINGAKSSMWKHYKRIISEIRPKFAYIENSPALIVRGLDQVICDLAQIGYDHKWGVFSSADIGAEHVRERIFILAHPHGAQLERGSLSSRVHQENTNTCNTRRGKDKSGVERTLNGVAFGSHRLKAIGNGQDPQVAARAFRILSEN